MLSILISIVALGFIIAFHELGHFVAAKAFKVGVIEFAIGFGPKILCHKGRRTDYSLRLLPFGGACMMLSEDEEPEKEAEINSADGAIHLNGRTYATSEQFSAKPAWQRFIIVIAGPVFNFLLAFLLAFVIISVYGSDRSDIVAVDEGFPMAEAGVEAGDVITGLSVRGTSGTHMMSVATARDIELFLIDHADALDGRTYVAVRFRDISDGGAEKEIAVVSRFDDATGSYRLGFSYSPLYIKTANIGETVRYSFSELAYFIRSTEVSLKLLFSGAVSRDEVMGPIGMVAVMNDTLDEAADYGLTLALMSLFELMALISGSLGAMNLLPIPALDGGRLVFIVIEMIFRRPVPRRLEGMVHAAGFALLFALMIFIMFNDAATLIFG